MREGYIRRPFLHSPQESEGEGDSDLTPSLGAHIILVLILASNCCMLSANAPNKAM